MSDLGPLTFGERDDLIFLGRDLAMHKNFSERTAQLIDEEVKKIIIRNYNRAKSLIEKNRDKLQAIAQTLLEREVLSSEEIERLLQGKPLKSSLRKKRPSSRKTAPPGKAKTRPTSRKPTMKAKKAVPEGSLY
jgi:cell division protease FtsH